MMRSVAVIVCLLSSFVAGFATAAVKRASIASVLAAPTPTEIKLGVPVTVSLSAGASTGYYVDVYSPVYDEIMTINGMGFVQVEMSAAPSTAYGKVKLERGTGSLFSDTRPAGNYYAGTVDVSSETSPGDCSGRWYVTLTMCDGCSGQPSSASFTITVYLRDFAAERTLSLSSKPNLLSLMGSQQRMWMVDPIRDPIVQQLVARQSWGNLTRPIRVDVRSSNDSAVAYIQMKLGSDLLSSGLQCPAGNTYDTDCSLRFGAQMQASAYFPEQLALQQLFATIQGCGDCEQTSEGTIYNGTVSAALQRQTSPEFIEVGQPVGVHSTSAGIYSHFFLNLTDSSVAATILVRNMTVGAYYKILARKGALASLSKNDASAPTGSDYSSTPSLTIQNPESSPHGLWYISVMQCDGCGEGSTQSTSTFSLTTVKSAAVEGRDSPEAGD